jgi:hypothetical protein
MSLYSPSHNLVMLSVIMVIDVMLSVIMVSDVMMSVVAPQLQLLKPSRQLVEQIIQNFFFFVTDEQTNQATTLVPCEPFQPILIFASKAGGREKFENIDFLFNN